MGNIERNGAIHSKNDMASALSKIRATGDSLRLEPCQSTGTPDCKYLGDGYCPRLTYITGDGNTPIPVCPDKQEGIRVVSLRLIPDL